VQDLKCSDDSLSEGSVTSADDVTAHVISDAGESRTAVKSDSESEIPQTMASITPRYGTPNSALRSPRETSPSNSRLSAGSQAGSASKTFGARKQTDSDGKADSSSVGELEKMLSEVEASERQAWSQLEALDAENHDRVGLDMRVVHHDRVGQQDLRHYMQSVEQGKRQTSEAIAQLLRIECSLRQQLNRKRAARGGSLSSDPDDHMLDDVSRSLNSIVQRLQRQQYGLSPTQVDADQSASRVTSSSSTAGLAYLNLNGGNGGLESDEGYSTSLQSNSLQGHGDNLIGYAGSLHGNRNSVFKKH